MVGFEQMDINQFDFALPQSSIALRPAEPRDSSKLLVVRPGHTPEDRVFSDLTGYLRPGDALVFNNARVIPAQFDGVRERNGNIAKVSVTLHQRLSGNHWQAFVKGAKKLGVGERISLGIKGKTSIQGSLDAEVTGKGDEGDIELCFDLSGPELDRAMMTNGQVPLPPYIACRRKSDERDIRDYQTIYACKDGAVAAPTAGLHFSEDIFSELDKMGVSKHFVTLYVGAGTFLPVKVDDVNDHKMHFENGMITAETAQALNELRLNGGRIISVGTTSLRLLESSTDENGCIKEWSGPTGIFIKPGYRFSVVDLLITNFHLPRSTLFMLVSAFCGLDVMQSAYAHAIEKNYRFYSYGDANLLFPDT